MPYFIYILECNNGSYYTGYTKDIERRYKEHSEGSSKCKYTRSFPPKRIAACWELNSDISVALKIEREIKRLPKLRKMEFINEEACLEEHLLKEGYVDLVIHRL